MYRSIFLLLFMICLFKHNTQAQEIRVQGNMLILGYIDDPFVGGGIGFESGVGEHFSFNADANWGSHERGTSLELRPSINYYFGMEHKGLFVGAAFKYITLSEKNDAISDWEDSLYSIGFNLGFKAVMSEQWTLAFTASPHKTVGGHTEGDVAGISAQLALGYRF